MQLSWGYESSYIVYLKLHILVVIFFFFQAQEQTNPWPKILATFFSLEYIALYWPATQFISSCTYL